MAPAVKAPYVMIFRAFLSFGILAILLGVDGACAKKGNRGQKKSTRDRSASDQLKKASTVQLVLDPSFITNTPPVIQAWNNSLSPWKYSYAHDKDLFPANIPEANCLKVGCLDLEGKEDMGLQSTPIVYQILVLRRVAGKRKNNLKFKLESRAITVGCTCVFPNVVSQN